MSQAAAPPYAEVIGDPIVQSKSPLIHKFWLDALGVDGSYRRAHVKSEGLTAYIAERRADPDWRGCNVTMPHKAAVMELVEDPGDIRGTIGAMNTIVRQPDGVLIGTNTDAAGFYAPFTGQGVTFALITAALAAEVAEAALAEDDLAGPRLAEYSQRRQEALGPRVRAHIPPR